MNYLRMASLSAVLGLSLTACGQSDSTGATEVSAPASPLLSYVPADTPYLTANLEPLPESVIDAYLDRWQPVMAAMQQEMTAARLEMEADGVAGREDDPAARLVLALMEELDGKLSREGLDSLGFDLNTSKVLYGLGAFPVGRVGLSDATEFRATVQRVLDRAAVEAPELEYQGVSYWRLADVTDPDEPMGLYVAIMPDHLAISLFPHAAEAELLPSFLGIEKPKDSDAAQRLAALNRKHGYTPHGSGILDLHRMADQFLQADTPLARTLAASGEFNAAELNPVCATEIHGMIDNMPIMTAGTTELTANSIAYEYRLEQPASLASQLVGLVADVPAAEAMSRKILEFTFGMRFGPARDFLREKAMAITQAPYQCEELKDLNRHAEEMLTQLNQPIPPFLNNFRGFRVSLDEISLNDGQQIPHNARGHVAVHVEQPQMFVGMAQMFIPDLSGLEILPGNPPVAIPETLIPVPGAVAFAAMTDDAIGMSLGAGEEKTLMTFLERDDVSEGTFLSADYDMAAYLEYTGRLEDSYSSEDVGGRSNDAIMAIAEAASEVVQKTSDRSRTEMKFTPEGVVIEGRMTFK
jgi:hypothetical protein